MAGLVKSIYILEKGIIPASLHFKDPNPEIPFDDWKIKVPIKNIIWPASKNGVRRISVNSFGFGGTNAHVILDDTNSYVSSRAYSRKPNDHAVNGHTANGHTVDGHASCDSADGQAINGHAPYAAEEGSRNALAVPRIFMLSASDQHVLPKVRAALHQWLDERIPDDLTSVSDIEDALEQSAESFMRDLALSLSERKSHLPWRSSCLARSIAELKQKLSSNEYEPFRSRCNIRIGFVFTGQGAQWARMGLGLMRYPVFRDSVQDADKYLRNELGTRWSAIDELSRPEVDSRLDDPELSQSLCTLLQIALVDLLATWDIKPTAVVGHSSGEIGAAYCLGALDKYDALRIAFFRGHLSSRLQAGKDASSEHGMLAVGASQSVAESHIRDTATSSEVVVACTNSGSSVTLSGTASSIELVSASLTEQSIFNRKLRVKMAYHSPQMELIAEQYSDSIRSTLVKEASRGMRMFSSVTGSLAEPGDLGCSNWVQNLVSPVCFKQAMESLLRSGDTGSASVDILLEVGPHCALQSPVQEILRSLGMNDVQYDSVLRRGKDAFDTAVALAGRLAAIGVPVDLVQVHSDVSTLHMDDFNFISDLPKYPWNHAKTYWAETRLTRHHKLRKTARTRLLGAPFAATSGSDFVWRNFLRLSEEPWMRDHQVQGNTVFPAAGFIAIAVEGAKQMVQKKVSHYTLRDVLIVSALLPSEEDDVEIVLQLRRRRMGTLGSNNSSWYDFSISSSSNSRDLKENCRGLIKTELEHEQSVSALLQVELDDQQLHTQYLSAKTTCGDVEDINDFYDMLSARGLFFGPSFRSLKSLSCAPQMRCFEVEVPVADHGQDDVDVIHPTTLDSILQSWNPGSFSNDMMAGRTVIPSSFDEIIISDKVSAMAGDRMLGWSSWATQGLDKFHANITVMDAKSQHALLKVNGMKLTSLDNPAMSSAQSGADTVFSSRVQWIPVQAAQTNGQQEHPSNGEVAHAASIDTDDFKPLNIDAVTIVGLSRPSEMACHLTAQLLSHFHHQRVESDSVCWDDDPQWQRGRLYIVMLEIEHAFLANLSERDWQRLKKLFARASNVLWLVKNDTPDAGTVLGLARVVRNELGSLDLRTLRITQHGYSQKLIQLVGNLALHTTDDHEFREMNGNLEVSRIVPLEDLDRRVIGHAQKSEEAVTLGDFDMKLSVQQPGLLDTLCFEPDYDAVRPLGPDDIEIDVRATGLK